MSTNISLTFTTVTPIESGRCALGVEQWAQGGFDREPGVAGVEAGGSCGAPAGEVEEDATRLERVV